MAKPVTIQSQKHLEMALHGKPHNWAIALASRGACRSVPSLIWLGSAADQEALFVALFRCLLVARLAALGKSQADCSERAAKRAARLLKNRNVSSKDSYNIGIALSVAKSAISAALSSINNRLSVKRAAYSSVRGAMATLGEEGLNLVDRDWEYLINKKDSSAASLINRALDPILIDWGPLIGNEKNSKDRYTDFFSAVWRDFCADLLENNSNWQVWIDWWEAIRDGRPAWNLSRHLGNNLAFQIVSWPEAKWIRSASEINAEIAAMIDAARTRSAAEELANDSPLEQGEGPYRFEEVDGQIFGRPGAPDAFDEVFAEGLRGELLGKLNSLIDRARSSNSASRVVAGLERLRDVLGNSIADIAPGVLLSASRTVLNDRDVFDYPEARGEVLPEVLSAIRDVTATLEDLMAAFPSILRIERDRLALGLIRNQKRLKAQREQIAELQAAADASPVVHPSARSALHRFDAAANEAESIDLLAAIVADQLLVVRAFGAQTANSLGAKLKSGAIVAGDELTGLGRDSWLAIRKGLPEGLEKGSEKFGKALPALGLAALGWLIAGPIGGLAGTVPALDGIRKRLDKLLKIIENSSRAKKPKTKKTSAEKPRAKKPSNAVSKRKRAPDA